MNKDENLISKTIVDSILTNVMKKRSITIEKEKETPVCLNSQSNINNNKEDESKEDFLGGLNLHIKLPLRKSQDKVDEFLTRVIRKNENNNAQNNTLSEENNKLEVESADISLNFQNEINEFKASCSILSNKDDDIFLKESKNNNQHLINKNTNTQFDENFIRANAFKDINLDNLKNDIEIHKKVVMNNKKSFNNSSNNKANKVIKHEVEEIKHYYYPTNNNHYKNAQQLKTSLNNKITNVINTINNLPQKNSKFLANNSYKQKFELERKNQLSNQYNKKNDDRVNSLLNGYLSKIEKEKRESSNSKIYNNYLIKKSETNKKENREKEINELLIELASNDNNTDKQNSDLYKTKDTFYKNNDKKTISSNYGTINNKVQEITDIKKFTFKYDSQINSRNSSRNNSRNLKSLKTKTSNNKNIHGYNSNNQENSYNNYNSKNNSKSNSHSKTKKYNSISNNSERTKNISSNYDYNNSLRPLKTKDYSKTIDSRYRNHLCTNCKKNNNKIYDVSDLEDESQYMTKLNKLVEELKRKYLELENKYNNLVTELVKSKRVIQEFKESEIIKKNEYNEIINDLKLKLKFFIEYYEKVENKNTQDNQNKSNNEIDKNSSDNKPEVKSMLFGNQNYKENKSISIIDIDKELNNLDNETEKFKFLEETTILLNLSKQFEIPDYLLFECKNSKYNSINTIQNENEKNIDLDINVKEFISVIAKRLLYEIRIKQKFEEKTLQLLHNDLKSIDLLEKTNKNLMTKLNLKKNDNL